MPKYPGISPYDNEKGTLGTAKKRWEKIYVKDIESDTINGMNAEIENLATTAENSVSQAVAAKNAAETAKTAAQTAAETAATAAAGIQSVVETDVDATLSIPGVAADAKVTGDWLNAIAKPVTGSTETPGPCDEFLQYIEDADHRLLFGIKRDGTVDWQKGVPQHLQNRISEIAFPIIENDEYLYVMLDDEQRVLFGVKKDGSFDWQKGTPKHVIEACNPTMENDEYLYAIVDPEEHVLLGIKRDGSVDWQKGTPKHVVEACNPTIKNDEYLYAILDTEEHILFGVKRDGSVHWQKNVPNVIKDYVSSYIQQYHYYPLAGKRWAAFGDSITAGGINRTPYQVFVAENTGVVAINYGVGGTGYMQEYPSGANNSFLDRIQNINPDNFDFMTIFGSGNDKNGYTMGNITDTTDTTVLGRVNLTIEAYLDIAKKPLGVVTPYPLAQYAPSDTGNWMEEYSNAIIQIAHRHSIPVLDLYHESGIIAWDSIFRTKYFAGDGVHINSLGAKTYLMPMFREFIYKLA